MSLVEQSQQWFPTSVQVTVHQARNLRAKGKNGTSDSYAIIQVAKDKFSTTVVEKSVEPVWKEEASFELPLFHPGNAERCTLHVVVMHRAQVGLDKFLGQAVVNLVDLHENKGRKKTDWFKLVDKSGKEDKARGEVLLDIQFMRNNMSASMFDLSMQDKPRSRISKLKDKVRGKKKDSFSDSASAIVPSVSQVLTDSEGEPDTQSLSQSPGTKKKSKFKKLFVPKSNLQRNTSQSMSTLGALPEKNSSLSGSRSSGLNVDSPEVKKKFKFLGHKRTGSSDSRVSQGPFSLLGRSKQSNNDPNSLCINGSHVYAEETEPKTGSTLSLNSSGQGSLEDVHRRTSDVYISVPDPALIQDSSRASVEQQRHQEEEQRRQAEARRLEEEEKHRVELKRLQEEEEHKRQEEQERKRRFLEDEAMRKKQQEEEEERRRRENQRLEEQKQQEEASMSERLSSLFGILRKKEEKKEEAPEPPAAVVVVDPEAHEDPSSAFFTNPFEDIPLGLQQPASRLSSSNPFDEVPLGSDPVVVVGTSEGAADHQKPGRAPPAPSAMVFLNRTAKVSAVKPRLTQSLVSEPSDIQTLGPPRPSPAAPDLTLSSVSSESPASFSDLHSSLAPPNSSQSRPGSPFGSTESLASVESADAMSDRKRAALLPPVYPPPGSHSAPMSEIRNSNAEEDRSQPRKKSLPLPDYETLFPQKRHGVQGETRWDHIIAEVNQKNRDAPPVLLGPEMSVDGPERRQRSPRSSVSLDGPAIRHYQSHLQETKPVSSKKVAAPAPPKPYSSLRTPSPDVSTQWQNQNTTQDQPDNGSRESLSSRDGDGRARHSLPAATHVSRTTSQRNASLPDNDRKTPVSMNQDAPTAKPRQKKDREDAAATPDRSTSGRTPSGDGTRRVDKSAAQAEDDLSVFDPYFNNERRSRDTRTQQNDVDKEQRPESRGMTAGDLDDIFSQDKPADPFAGVHGRDNGTREDSKPIGFHVFQRSNSQRQKQALASRTNPQSQEVTKEFTLQSGAETNASSSSEPLQIIPEDPAEKTPLQARVSPSEVQPVSAQHSTGGPVLSARRPHAVKPLTSLESQHVNQSVKDVKVWDNTPGKIKTLSDSGRSGPFSQLTQEELITLVVKQQTDLSKKDSKIVELEDYIDKLLLRVMEEKPSILATIKPV